MSPSVKVTRNQVHAAQIVVDAYRSAGLEPDPRVVRLAQAGRDGSSGGTTSVPRTAKD